MIRERSYQRSDGSAVLLKSERGITKERDGWVLRLRLYSSGRFGKRLIEERKLSRSQLWSTNTIELLQAQEELEMLRAAGVEIELLELLR